MSTSVYIAASLASALGFAVLILGITRIQRYWTARRRIAGQDAGYLEAPGAGEAPELTRIQRILRGLAFAAVGFVLAGLFVPDDQIPKWSGFAAPLVWLLLGLEWLIFTPAIQGQNIRSLRFIGLVYLFLFAANLIFALRRFY